MEEPIQSGKYESPEQQVDLKKYWIILLKRKWTILVFMAITVTIVTLGTLRMPKIYQAVSSLIIDTAAPEVLSGIREVVEVGGGGYWFNRDYYETQYKILQSRQLAHKVAENLGLQNDLKFLGIDYVKDPVVQARIAAGADVEALVLSRYRIQPIKDSRIVTIIVEDRDPKFAALLSNAIADAYIEMNLETKLEVTRNAANWLAEQLRDLKDKMEKSEIALFDFKKESNILSVSLEESQNMTAQRLRAFNEELSKMMAERIEIEAKQNYIKDLKVTDKDYERLEQVLGSALVNSMKTDYYKARETFLAVSEKYGPKHPKYQIAKGEMELSKMNLEREINNVIGGIELKYLMLVETEKSLKIALKDTETAALEINKKEIDYRRLKRDVDNNGSLYELVMKRLKETDLTGMLKNNNIHKLDFALVPKSPIKPRVKVNILISLFVGIIGGIGLAFLFDYFDNTIKTQDDIEHGIGLTFLGFIPTISDQELAKKGNAGGSRDLYLLNNPKSNLAESCRAIRTNLMFVSPGKPLTSMIVTSAGPQEGKSITSVNIAVSMAMSGSKTVLVDADLRRPRLHKVFNRDNEAGVTTYLVGNVSLDSITWHSDLQHLDVITCGPIPPNPAELMHTAKFTALIEELSKKYDRVIIDTPPVIAVTDAVIIAHMVDGVILVVKSAKSTKEMVKQAKKQLEDVNANIIGVVLNDLDLQDREHGYYYYYYYRKYGYYYGSKDKNA